MEWGCMQALIDFDGWRKWKDFSQKNVENEPSKKVAVPGKSKAKKNRMSLGSNTGMSGSVAKSIKEETGELKA
jgi:osomolarity two-component system, response regulator SSK1